MSCALQALHQLTARLGHEPSLEELYLYLSSDPAGRIVEPPRPVLPSQEGPEMGDGRGTAALQAEESMMLNPEIGKVQDQLLRLLLFGPLAPGAGPGLAPRSPAPSLRLGGGHGLPFGLS